MAQYQLLNERKEPLIGVTVEAVSMTTGEIMSRAQTDLNGVATFVDIPETGWYPRANITRHSGKTGDQANVGQANISPLVPETPHKPYVNPLIRKRLSEESPTNEGGSAAKEEERAVGELLWDIDGILKYWNGTIWTALGPDLPTADPGNGELWLECPA